MRSPLVLRFLLVLVLGSLPLLAQTAPPPQATQSPDALYNTIAQLDKEVFGAIDACDMTKFASFWSDDVEFYHDKEGLMTGRANLVDAVKNNLCGKVKRELVPGSLEVYPINGYGAVEIGVHRFLHPWKQDHGEIGEAKFIHLWQNTNGSWKITRVISFDHGPAKPAQHP